MASPSLTSGQFNTNLAHQVEKEGGWQKVGITSADLSAILTPADFMALFPVDAVMMWADHTTIPANWEVIPESVQRIPRGVSAPDPALVTGGSDTHLHDAHANHVVTQPADHTGTTGNNNASRTFAVGTGALTTVADDPHVHPLPTLSHTGGGVDAHDAHSTENNIPNYFTIFFIRKVA